MATLDASSFAPKIDVRSAGRDKGLGVFATAALPLAYTIIAVEYPLLAALDAERLEDTCYDCYRRQGDVPIEVQLGFPPCPLLQGSADLGQVKLSRCVGCKIVRYCSKACQKSSWTAHHSLECPVFKAAYPRAISNHARAVMRLLLLKKAGRIKAEDWEAFINCSSHTNEYQRNEKAEEFAGLKQTVNLIKQLLTFEVEDDLVLNILLRLKANSLTLQTPFHDPLGLALHPLLAKINHSCDPNAYVRFPSTNLLRRGPSGLKRSIILTPLRKIEAGEEITISYVDESSPYTHRRQELEARYFFNCNCLRCVKEEEDDVSRTITLRAWLHSIEDRAKTLLEDIIGSKSSMSHEDQAKQITDFIRSLWDGEVNWNVARYPYPQLLHQLILTHIDMQDFSFAFRLAILRYYILSGQVYKQDGHPLPIVHCIVVLKLAGVIIDGFEEAATTDSSAALSPSKEMDMKLWSLILGRQIVLNANSTWTEQPWPWLLEATGQGGPLNDLAASPGGLKRLESAEEKMSELCIDMLKTLKGK